METIRRDIRLTLVVNATLSAAKREVLSIPSMPVYLPPHFGTGHARETQGLRYWEGQL